MRDPVLLGILAVALGLSLIGIDWGLPFSLSWSIDDLSPWKPLSLPWRWTSAWHKYPYLHWFISLAFYAPYLAWLALRGELDTACLPSIDPLEGCFVDGYGAPTVLMGISRGISLVMALGIVASIYVLARQLTGDRGAARVAAALVAVAPGVVLYAHLGNLDIPVTFWFVLSLVFAVRLVQRGALRDYALFGLAAAFAVATKAPIIGAYVLTGPALVALHLAQGRALFDRRLLTLVGVLLFSYALIQNLFFNPQGFFDHWRFWLPTGEFIQGERTTAPSAWHTWRHVGEAWRHVVGWPAFGVSLAGLVWVCLRRERAAWLAVPMLSYLVFSVVLSAFVAERILLPVAVVGCVLGGALLARGLAAPALRLASAALLAGVLGYAALASLHQDLLLLRDGRYAAEAWFAGQADRDRSVASCSAAVDLPRLELQGIAIQWIEPEEDCLAGVARLRPDLLVVSAASPRNMGRGLPGYELVWEGRGRSPLGRWFPAPYSWLNPRIRVFERAT